MPAPAGDALSRRMAAWMRAPAPAAAVRARMNYPYAQAWTGRFRGARPIEPRWPLLYVWGTRKPFMFHSPDWIERLAATPGCAAHGLRAGHWVMRDRAAEFESLVDDWLAGEAAPAPAARGV